MTVDLSVPAAPGIDEVAAWDDAHRYTPAPRHRRRLLLKLLGASISMTFSTPVCAQPFLLDEVVRRFQVPGFGCDLSQRVIDANRHVLPHCEFRTLDLTREVWPDARRFDLVVCSEVLEHLVAWCGARERRSHGESSCADHGAIGTDARDGPQGRTRPAFPRTRTGSGPRIVWLPSRGRVHLGLAVP